MKISDYKFEETPKEFDFTSLTDFLNYVQSQGYQINFNNESNIKYWINEFNEYVAQRKQSR